MFCVVKKKDFIELIMEEQRCHARVYLPPDAGVYVSSQSLGLMGPVRVIGLGGLFFQALGKEFSIGSPLTLELTDGMRRVPHHLDTTIRNVSLVGIGVAFVDLPPVAMADVERLVSQYG